LRGKGKRGGYTLVEIVVSLAVAGVILLGVVLFMESFFGTQKVSSETVTESRIMYLFTTIDEILPLTTKETYTSSKVEFSLSNGCTVRVYLDGKALKRETECPKGKNAGGNLFLLVENFQVKDDGNELELVVELPDREMRYFVPKLQ